MPMLASSSAARGFGDMHRADVRLIWQLAEWPFNGRGVQQIQDGSR
jgi:hypothetical protein